MKATKNIILSKPLPEELNQTRLDIALSTLFADYSRARLQQWIKEGKVTVDEKILEKSDKVHTGQNIKITIIAIPVTADLPQKIKLDVIYEDNDLLVINKPAGLTVHPGAGQRDQTLLNALLYYDSRLKNIPRAGIVHRLDKDTSGLLVVARNLKTQNKLVKALQKHRVTREYEAIVYGHIISGGTINAPIKRHATKRTLMTVAEDGREAITHYRIIERFSHHTHLKIILETGRTHQIRVHLAHLGYPIVGDKTYGRLKIPKNASQKLAAALKNCPRQMLHAKSLALTHPTTKKQMEWHSELPKDMKELLRILKTLNKL